MELEPKYKVMALEQEANDQLAWLQSQVIVLDEGELPRDGDIVSMEIGEGGFDHRMTIIGTVSGKHLHLKIKAEKYGQPDGWLYGLTLGREHKILARICPIEGKLKPVVYKKGAVCN